MAAIAQITIADGQATPVNKTFDVQMSQQGNDPAVWLEKTSGSYNGFKRLSLLTRRSESNKATKVSIKIVDPTLAVTAPASGTGIQPNPVQAYAVLGTLEFVLPDACTLQNRKDILAYAKNVLANAIVVDAVNNLAPAF